MTWGPGTSGLAGAVSVANSLVGSQTSDQVGATGVTALTNGNYVVRSRFWDNGAVADAGAVTWGPGTSGISGAVSAANSLVGTRASDGVGSGGVTALTNGNYVVASPLWDNGALASVGAVTWGSGTRGVAGAVSAANSLVGASANDSVGNGGVAALNTGGYVVGSPNFASNAGRVMLFQAPRTETALFSTPFSNPDPAAGDSHGSGGVTGLATGNIVVASPLDDFAATDAGAVYLYHGNSGALLSSLRGSKSNDQVGSGGVTALTIGNYVVASPLWGNGALANAGAVTWGSGTSGITGAVSVANSLVGSAASDSVGGGGVTALTNGSYVVASPLWDNGSAANAGAVTWGSGASGTTGAVSAANSLIGRAANDNVGSTGITALTNGNYVVQSPNWFNGSAGGAGAVTWGSGTGGITGLVSVANSLVGSTPNDQVGLNGVTLLANGDYVVRSVFWNNSGASRAGATTWGSGTSGVTGAVSAANSLVGGSADDRVGSGGVTPLGQGGYVVRSPLWDNGAATNAGAATRGSSGSGIAGVVSAANSLVGTSANDQVGSGGVTALTNGHYVVASPSWSDGARGSAGAVTWGSGTSGIAGAVSAANSLVGGTANDQVGLSGVIALTNGNYVAVSARWNGAVPDVGAVTWSSGTSGIIGVVSAANSLVGSTTGDRVGSGAVLALRSGSYVVVSPLWNNGGALSAGAVTWSSGTSGITGPVSTANSLVGTTQGDQLGRDSAGGIQIVALPNGNYVVSSPLWDNGATVNAGAVTWGSGTSGVAGIVSGANSLVGSTAADQVGSRGVTVLNNSNFIVRSPNWDGAVADVGAVTWGSGTSGLRGAVHEANSLVGSAASDRVGSGDIVTLANGNYVVASPDWANGLAAQAGAVTWAPGTTGITGQVGAANSLVGNSATERTGSGGIVALTGDRFVVNSPNGAFGGARLDLVSVGQAFASQPGLDVTIASSALASTLAAGTNVNLEANNDITVTHSVNVGGSAGGALNLNAGRSIVFNAGLTTANGNLTARANDPNAIAAQRDAGSGDIVIGAGVMLDVGTGIANLAGQKFTNSSGAAALRVTGAGRWLVWSGSPAEDVRGALVYDFKQYAASFGVTAPAQAAGNGFLYTLAPTITPRVTGTVTKQYDGDATATVAGANLSAAGVVDGDTVTLSQSGTATYDNRNAGSAKTVNETGVGIASTRNGTAAVYGYALGTTTATGNVGEITRRAITASAVTDTRTYDGSTSSTALPTITSGTLAPTGGDTASFTERFDNRNAGTNKTLTATGTVNDGNAGTNYAVTFATNTTGVINRRQITVAAATDTRTYDGSTNSTATPTITSGTLAPTGGDTAGFTQSFDHRNAGTNKTLTATGTVNDGNAGSNYAVTFATNTTGVINRRPITVTAATDTRTYDGSTNSTATPTITSGTLPGRR